MEDFIDKLNSQLKDEFVQNKNILTFDEYLKIVKSNPYILTRNAVSYLHDCILFFGTELDSITKLSRFKIFDIGSERYGPIIGGEYYQNEIYKTLSTFKRQGFANKLITLHGPNGSAKTSTIESLCRGMQLYSQTDEGAVYRFNWIFPTDKLDPMKGEEGAIGFKRLNNSERTVDSYAFIDESKISCKIHSEFNENPIFLIPMPYREEWLKKSFKAYADKNNDEEIPRHLLLNFLSKKNQLIYENLMNAYDGDFKKVMRHIQVERFYYSKQYRVGLSTVEPQAVVDAHEKQLTYDKNITNLPNVLHNIRFTETVGPIVEANRGFLEYSDLLKRPIEALKYLLTTIEKSSMSLPSTSCNLDIVFFATTNEKQLDAFKTTPEFSSFSARFEFITVPYLLNYKQEARIYDHEVNLITKSKKMSPHCIELLSLWAVMTRLKQPDLEKYPANAQPTIKKINPLHKAKIIAHDELNGDFSKVDLKIINENSQKIINESKNLIIYEGRFGASPRELKSLLGKTQQTASKNYITPMDVFSELEHLIKNLTVHEFLQYEPRSGFHDAKFFIKLIKEEFAKIFEGELLESLNLIENEEYDLFLRRYLAHVVANIKNEKFYNDATAKYESPSEDFMTEVEAIIADGVEKKQFRQQLLNKVAAHRIDNPDGELDVQYIFKDLITKFRDHYYKQKQEMLNRNFNTLIKWSQNETASLSETEIEMANNTFTNLKIKFNYSEGEAIDCLRFLINYKNSYRD